MRQPILPNARTLERMLCSSLTYNKIDFDRFPWARLRDSFPTFFSIDNGHLITMIYSHLRDDVNETI